MPSCRRSGRRRSRRSRRLAAPTRPVEPEEAAGERAGTRKTSSCSLKLSTYFLLEPTPGRTHRTTQVLFLRLLLWDVLVLFIQFILSLRWEVIANYMNQHSTSGMKRNAKDVINKAKNLQRLGTIYQLSAACRAKALHCCNQSVTQYLHFLLLISTDPVQKDEINRKAFEKFKKEHTSVPPSIDNAVPSERFDGECFYQNGKKLFRKYVREAIVSQIQLLWACNWLCVHPQRLVVMGTLLPGPQKNRNFWSKPWKPTQWAHLSAGRRSPLPSRGEARKTVWRGTR